MSFKKIALELFIYLFLFTVFGTVNSFGQVVKPAISYEPNDEWFSLVTSDKSTSIYIDDTDYKVVATAARHFADDIKMVTSQEITISTSEKNIAEYAVIIGTIGRNRQIDKIIENKKLDVTSIEGKWESCIIATIEQPLPGIRKALVIAGSDRRGTAYGVFTLSEAMGVSPWYWWADVHPTKRKQLFVEPGIFIQGPPSVKYRGIFINDEGFGGLNVWARKTYETEIGDIGPKTYAKVFELMLRLKANYCWPAMHACTKPFYSYPQNPVVADQYAIVIGTSHCEQMHCNTMTEWDVTKQGAWNYKINPGRIQDFWEDRIRLTQNYENIYTLGMRGTEDIEMEGAESIKDMVDITQQTIADQRGILEKSINAEIESIPQVLCTYKEVLVTYQNGLDVPDDVTLLWADDNHGYTRQLCTPEEQKRSGGSGVYYHLSLLGTPEGYLWLNTISPSLVAYEMTKAYEYGADRIWMFNIGDIKPHEKELTFAMQMAWDINRWTPHNTHLFMKEWAAQTFGVETAADIAAIMDRYYTLAASGKPEHSYRLDYSSQELNNRIEEYRKLSERVIKLKRKIPDNLIDAYYQLIEYPVVGCHWMNERNLIARRSLQKAAAGDPLALKDAEQAKYCHAQLDSITHYYNAKNAGGKWNFIMSWHPWMSEMMPEVANAMLLKDAQHSLASHTVILEDIQYTEQLDIENGFLVVNRSSEELKPGMPAGTYSWQSDTAGEMPVWLFATIPTTYVPSYSLSVNDTVRSNELKHIGNIWHTQAAAPIWYNLGMFPIKKGENTMQLSLPDSLLSIGGIHVGWYPPSRQNYLQQIMSDDYVQSHNTAQSSVHVIDGLGLGKGVSILPFTAPSLRSDQMDQAAWIEYLIELPQGASEIEIRTLPTQRIHNGRGVRYGVSINEEKPRLFDIQADEFTPEWQDNVIRGYTARKISLSASNNDKIKLRFYFLDPGVVIRDIVIY